RMKYFTRLRTRRRYRWCGEPLNFNRRLKTFEYASMAISVDGLPRTTTICTGQHILIEGDDDDHPYVARVLRLFGDAAETGRQKKAAVQWFARVSEVPPPKLKLLGREPHPQEVFFYQGRGCDDEVDAESILRPVQVKHLEAQAPFPAPGAGDTLYVKLSWDTKTFRVVDSAVVNPSPPDSAPARRPKPSLPPSPPSSPPAAAPAPRGPAGRALPTPDLAVMRRAATLRVPCSKATMSAGRAEPTEAESLHSSTKLSASKCLSARRRDAAARTPSCPRPPLRPRPSTTGSRPSSESRRWAWTLSCRSGPAALRPTARPGTDSNLRVLRDRAPTLSGLTGAEGGDLPLLFRAEADHENSPAPLATTTPRSSKRKTAQLVSSRIRRQLFVPSRRELDSSEEDDEEEVASKRGRRTSSSETPRSKRRSLASRTPQRTPNKVAAPRTPRQANPSIPSRSLPARQPANVLEEARTRLHVSSVPESLPCREQEFQDIYSFVESKITDGTGGCMYISGVPGTGKTATVHEVIRCLQHAADADQIPPFTFVEINGMKMTEPHQAYVQVLQKLTGQKATADHAAALLERRFSKPAPRKETTVLLVDELDLLWTRKQNVMYNLFDWPTRRHARLVVLTIANTMDLPERIMINRVASRLGLTRMSFQPYTFKQLQQILTSRLNKLKAFEEDALQLVSRKVAALSGDARRCLDICRRATEICELVGMGHVMEALNEMFSSAYVAAIRSASLQEQLFLRAVIAEFRRLGLEEATFQQVLLQHQALCRVEGLPPVGVSEGLAACLRLGACRLLLLDSSRLGLLMRVRLNASQDDVLFALKAD
uniref:Origin recognition complex subunit 1 n=1 Tax=Tetraodon nigroviridis TaxID=99883 RepID=H3CJ02_TETNG